jgi:hypothetical protein
VPATSAWITPAWSGEARGVLSDAVAGQGSVSLVQVQAPVPVPEPGTWQLMAAGLAALGVAARRRA